MSREQPPTKTGGPNGLGRFGRVKSPRSGDYAQSETAADRASIRGGRDHFRKDRQLLGRLSGRPIDAEDRPALERLAAYILRPSFAASRLAYDPEQGQIEYRTPKGVRRTLEALDWIARVTSPIPGPREQMTRYSGRYSNAARGKRRLAACQETAHGLPAAEDSEQNSAAENFSRQRRRNWARLLRKVYEVDALACPKCGHALEIIAVIEKPSVIEAILQHLDRWQQPERAPPPRLFPQKLESFLAQLSPQQAQAVRASHDALFWDEVPTWED